MSLRLSPLGLLLPLNSRQLCSRCLSKLDRRVQSRPLQRSFTTSCLWLQITENRQEPLRALDREYFLASEPLSRTSVKNTFFTALPYNNSSSKAHIISARPPSSKRRAEVLNDTSGAPIVHKIHQISPYRRRKWLKRESHGSESEPVIPPDASSRLSSLSSSLPETSFRRKLAAYLALTKPRLSFLILLTTTSAYGLYPISSLLTLDPSISQLPTLSTSTLTFLYLTTGTFLSAASANSLNMFFEPQYDARMSRTKNRPLVRGLLSKRGALSFAIATGVTGVTLLYMGTNPTVAALSAANILLYAFVYTPLKRIHVANTWVGAVVGGIPPMMGWVAAAGQTATTGHDTWHDMLLGEESIGGWFLAALLFAWQFPHFNSLSHTIREEYKAAGYKMMAWTNPARNARVSLRYSILMFPISFGLWFVGVVDNSFLVGSSIANGWLVKEAYRFWKYQGAKGTARNLFWASVWQLPILMIGALIAKKGIWDGFWRSIAGGTEDDEDILNNEDDGGA